MTPWTLEIDRIDWNAYACACGERGHLGDDLRRIIEARSLAEWGGASLDGHVEDQSMGADVAAPAIGVMMAALQEDLAVHTRSEFRSISGDSSTVKPTKASRKRFTSEFVTLSG
ncbi:hypothetical protein [Streptomyces rishiriensis]|uniref:hypothetical protein n=1 Tax=Streptomyces rishiriensis TaxID=68264 RepID=UPI0037D2DC19